MPKLESNIKQDIINDLQKDKPLKEISQSHNVSRSTVARIKKEHFQILDETREKAIKNIDISEKSLTSTSLPLDNETFQLEDTQELDEAILPEVILPPPLPVIQEPSNHPDPLKGQLVEDFMMGTLNNVNPILEKPAPKPKTKPIKENTRSPRKNNKQVDFMAGQIQEQHRSEVLHSIYTNVLNYSSRLSFISDSEKFLKELHKKDTPELVALARVIETQKDMGGIKSQIKNSFFSFCGGAEMILSRFLKLKCQGLTGEFQKQEEELDDIFQEMAIQYSEKIKEYVRPEVKLLMLFSATALKLDSINRQRETVEKFYDKQADPEVAKKYEDL